MNYDGRARPSTYEADIGMSRGETHLDQHVVRTTRITMVQVVCIIYLHQSNCINANIMNILLPALISQTQMLAVMPKLLFYLNTIINMIQLLIGHIVQ